MSDGWMPGAVRVPSPNFWVGNHSRRAACLHVVQGSFRSALSEFQSSRTQKSAHFTIAKSGAIAQHVSIHDSAWANGLEWVSGRWRSPEGHWVTPSWPDLVPGVNPNRYTISIEHEGYYWEAWTAAMMGANTRVLRYIASEAGLFYVPHRTLIGHYEISPIDRAFCPGPHVDYVAIAAAANGQLRFRVAVDTALVRQGPGQQFPVALDGTAKIHLGDILIADGITAGTPPAGSTDPRWVHRADGVGFVHISLLDAL
jgi:N-acetyl-anhydromuramyl-L-alanine amidase AmpD